MEDTIKMFVKFGSKVNLQQMLNQGIIYLNSIQYFRKLEDQYLRGDSYEGVSRVMNYPPGDIEIKDLNYKGKYQNIHLSESYEQVLGNVFSLYCISSNTIPKPWTFKVDERVLQFGSHCLIVKDNLIFFKMIEDSLKKLGYEFTHGFVKYYDRYKVNKEMNLFEKPIEFKYQNEFRFYIKSDDIQPLTVELGSLKDIAEIITSEKFLTLQLVPK